MVTTGRQGVTPVRVSGRWVRPHRGPWSAVGTNDWGYRTGSGPIRRAARRPPPRESADEDSASPGQQPRTSSRRVLELDDPGGECVESAPPGAWGFFYDSRR